MVPSIPEMSVEDAGVGRDVRGIVGVDVVMSWADDEIESGEQISR